MPPVNLTFLSPHVTELLRLATAAPQPSSCCANQIPQYLTDRQLLDFERIFSELLPPPASPSAYKSADWYRTAAAAPDKSADWYRTAAAALSPVFAQATAVTPAILAEWEDAGKCCQLAKYQSQLYRVQIKKIICQSQTKSGVAEFLKKVLHGRLKNFTFCSFLQKFIVIIVNLYRIFLLQLF
jgi:hypothetical protein